MRESALENKPRKSWVNILLTTITVLIALLCLYMAIQVLSQGYVDLGGYSLFRVVTGSMEPTLPVGSLLVARQVDMQNIQVGDIICFRAQEAAIFGKMVTHRVVEVFAGVDGSLLFETKGDANPVLDGYLVTEANYVGKVIWHTGAGSMISKFFSFFSNKVGFLSCIVFPCFLLSGLILRDCVQNIRKELAAAMEETNEEQAANVLSDMTQEERNAMYERIRAELIEELKKGAEEPTEQ